MRIYLQGILLILFLASCAVKPPREKGEFRNADLVELIKLDSTLKLDIRYATANNFTGAPVYEEAKAYLQRPAAEAVVKADSVLGTMGYGLLIFDGYRPWSVTKLFWDITPEKEKIFVANPREGSRHNRGCAVDLSLYYLSSGKEVEMPSAYDAALESAYADYQGGTKEERENRDLLIQVMTRFGFQVYEYEWWHFDYKDWQSYRILNIPFSEINADAK
ncbi:MAG: M15 family metallopeptidase [Bacteroidales bacterium]|nr:M15 family metallopeptidase [Bacteroidales bacterium]